jgi:hypothetical protein
LLISKQNPIRAQAATKIRYYSDRLLAPLAVGDEDEMRAVAHQGIGIRPPYSALLRRDGFLSAGTKTTSVFEGEHASGGCERCAWRRTADLAGTSASCSGARLEARRSGVARREAL